MTTITEETLDEFVKKTDFLGGPNLPGSAEYWKNFEYRPTTIVDQSLDPFSNSYFEQQITLYKELSGREIDPAVNELTAFDVDHHVEAANPYGSQEPSSFVVHYLRLGNAIRSANLPPHPRILDMGAGWGLSSEFLATLGCRVTAVDINPAFVQLINRRQIRHHLNIIAVEGSFDDFQPSELFDAVLFYECLHHAMRPWELIARASKWLANGGKIIFAGEPVNDLWWRHWGMRLDPLSVYCVRKFGWFESGWSQPFITECFNRAGLSAAFIPGPDPEIGSACVATNYKKDEFLFPSSLLNFINPDEWYVEDKFITSKGRSVLNIVVSDDITHINFQIQNFRPKPIALKVINGKINEISKEIQPGETTIRCRLPARTTTLLFESDTWIPADEIGNSDRRRISFHIKGATLERFLT